MRIQKRVAYQTTIVQPALLCFKCGRAFQADSNVATWNQRTQHMRSMHRFMWMPLAKSCQ